MAISKRGRIDIEVGMKGLGDVDKMSGGVGKLSGSITGLGKSMTGSILKSGLMLGAIRKLTGGIGGMIDTALTWNDWIGSNTKELEGMTKATAGIIKPLDLMKTRQQLLGQEIKATEGQMQALAKAAILNARINKSDLGPGLERMTKAVLTGSDTAFRKLGIDAEFLGTKSEKTAQALAALEKHFSDVKITAENVNEEMGQMSAAMQGAVGEMGNAILTSGPFRSAFGFIKETVISVTESLRTFTKDAKAMTLSQIDFATRTITGIALMSEALSVGGVGPLAGIAAQATAMLPVLVKLRKEVALTVKEAKENAKMGPFQEFAVTTGPKAAAAAAAKAKAAAAKARAQRQARQAKEDAEINKLITPSKALVSPSESGDIIADLDRKSIAQKAYNDTIRDAADAIHEMTRAHRESHDPAKQAEVQAAEFALQVKDTGKEIGDMTKGALAGLAGGLFQAADAAILSGEGFGSAMAAMVKSTLLGIAQQALVKSLFYAAEGVAMATNPVTAALAPGYFASAAMMAAVAGVAGGAGLGMAAAGVGATKPTAGAGSSAAASDRPSAGGSSGRAGQDDRDINIAVHVGNLTDPSAIYHARQQLQADLQRAGA